MQTTGNLSQLFHKQTQKFPNMATKAAFEREKTVCSVCFCRELRRKGLPGGGRMGRGLPLPCTGKFSAEMLCRKIGACSSAHLSMTACLQIPCKQPSSPIPPLIKCLLGSAYRSCVLYGTHQAPFTHKMGPPRSWDGPMLLPQHAFGHRFGNVHGFPVRT